MYQKWVEHFLTEMEKIPDTFYAERIRNKINSMLEGWNYRLDPAGYVKLYINKVYQDTNNSGAKNHFSSECGDAGSLLFRRQKSTIDPSTGYDMIGDIYD